MKMNKKGMAIEVISNRDANELIAAQGKLMNLALEPIKNQSLFKSIEMIIHCPIVVISSNGYLIYNGSSLPLDQLLAQFPWSLNQVSVRRMHWQGLRVPLLHHDCHYGFVYYLCENTYITPIEQAVYDQATQLITHYLQMNQGDYLQYALDRDLSVLLQQYLNAQLSLDTIHAFMKKWNVHWLNKRYYCILFSFEKNIKAKKNTSNWDELHRYIRLIPELQKSNALFLYDKQYLIGLIPQTEDLDAITLQRIFENSLYKSMFEGVRIIISSPRKGLDQLMISYEECKRLLQTTQDWKIERSIINQQYFDMHLLLDQVPRNQLIHFYQYWIGDIVPGGKYYSSELYETICTYLDHDGQMNETARSLFIHRNTVAYRIEKVSEYLHIDIKQLNYIIKLKTAMLIYHMLERTLSSS